MDWQHLSTFDLDHSAIGSYHVSFSQHYELLYGSNAEGNAFSLSIPSLRRICSFPVFVEDSVLVNLHTSASGSVALCSKSLHLFNHGLFPSGSLYFRNCTSCFPTKFGQARILSVENSSQLVNFSRGICLFNDLQPCSYLYSTSISSILNTNQSIYLGYKEGRLIALDKNTFQKSLEIQEINSSVTSIRIEDNLLGALSTFDRHTNSHNFSIYDLRFPSSPLHHHSLPQSVDFFFKSVSDVVSINYNCSFATLSLSTSRISVPFPQSWRKRTSGFSISPSKQLLALVDAEGKCSIYNTGTPFVTSTRREFEFPAKPDPPPCDNDTLRGTLSLTNQSVSKVLDLPNGALSLSQPVIKFSNPEFSLEFNRIVNSPFDPSDGTFPYKTMSFSGKVLGYEFIREPVVVEPIAEDLPFKYRKHYKNFDLINEFDWTLWNSTAFSGIENQLPYSCLIPILFSLYFDDSFRLFADRHHCHLSFCLLCECLQLFEQMDTSCRGFGGSVLSKFTLSDGNLVCPRTILSVAMHLLENSFEIHSFDDGQSFSFFLRYFIEEFTDNDLIELKQDLFINSVCRALTWPLELISRNFSATSGPFPDCFVIDMTENQVSFNKMLKGPHFPQFFSINSKGQLRPQEVQSSDCYWLDFAIFAVNNNHFVGVYRIPLRFRQYDHDFVFCNDFYLEYINFKEFATIPSFLKLVCLKYMKKPQFQSFFQFNPLVSCRQFSDIQARFDLPLDYSVNSLFDQVRNFSKIPFNFLDDSNTNLVGIDCEFVELFERGSAIQPRLSVGRVSAVLLTDDGFSPILDDHIVQTESVADFLTLYSGLGHQDLDPDRSSVYLCDLKNSYLKLKYLVLKGFVFVGHGIKKDLYLLNLVIPPLQIVDTVLLFRLPGRRYLSLKLLSLVLLGKLIQTGGHDSIIDATASLELYLYYLNLVKDGLFEIVMEKVYELSEFLLVGKEIPPRDFVARYLPLGLFPGLYE
ncbi:hypothetical protein P9112_011281 [Eukaryota sp. TZLM1-RC]